jgi:hypothetical protein
MERIYRKDVEKIIRKELSEKIMVDRISSKLKKSSFDTLLKDHTLSEVIEEIKEAFENAERELSDIPKENLIIKKTTWHGMRIVGTSIETDEEHEKRIQMETDRRLFKIRNDKIKKNAKKKRIESEINNLKLKIDKLNKINSEISDFE